MQLAGTYTALITPFRNGSFDRDAFAALIDAQAKAGVDGIVPVGTTGESPTLDHQEHTQVIAAAVEATQGRLQVVAGTGANSTTEAVSLTRTAEAAGATASLQVCPYYNKPSQEGLYRHFRTVAEATSLPIMLYSIPGRSVIEIAVDTVARLAADCPNIVAIKEAGGSSDRVNQLVQALPESFSVLSGDDPLTLPFMACGAVGVVSVAANIIPDVMARLVRACRNGSFDEALAVQKQYYPLFRGLMSLATNPVPIKTALALQDRCTEEFRLPMTPMDDAAKAKLAELLRNFDLI